VRSIIRLLSFNVQLSKRNYDLNFPPIFIKLAGIVVLDFPNNTNINILSQTHDTREQILRLTARH